MVSVTRIVVQFAFLLAVLHAPAVLAQSMHKCKDAAGKITYSGQACEDLGLQSAGGIQERSSTAPAYRPPPPATVARPKPVPSPAVQGAPAAQGAPAPASTDPDRRCFKTAKGFRCNDVPDEKN